MELNPKYIYPAMALFAITLSSCGVVNSTKKFVTDSAQAVKNVFVPTESDSAKVDNHVREAFRIDGDTEATQTGTASGTIVSDINNVALNKDGMNSPSDDIMVLPDTTEAPSAAEVSPTAVKLAGEWIVMSAFDKSVEGDERPYITFDAANGMFYGSNGCNIINGTVGGDGVSTVTFDNVLSTMRECADAPYQYIINMALPQVKSFTVTAKGQESYLNLLNGRKQVIMTLRKNNMEYINGAWTVTSINGETVEAGKVTLSIDLPELRIHGNAGCNIINGELYLDPEKPNSLQFGQLATTRMTCPDIQLEMNFLLTIETVESCKADGQDRITLYNASANPVMTLQRMNIARE